MKKYSKLILLSFIVLENTANANWFKDAWNRVKSGTASVAKSAVSGAVNIVKQIPATAFQNVKNLASGTYNTIKSAPSIAVNAAKNLGQTFANTGKNLGGSLASLGRGDFKGFGSGIINTGGSWIGGLGNTLGGAAAQTFNAAGATSLAKIAEGAAKLTNNIPSTIVSVGKGLAGTGVNTLQNLAGAAGNLFSGNLGGVVSSLSNAGGALGSGILNTAGNTTGQILTTLGAGSIGKTVTGLTDAASTGINTLSKLQGDIAQGAWKTGTSLLTGHPVNALKELKNTATSSLDTLGRGATSIATKATDSLQSTLNAAGNLTGKAAGLVLGDKIGTNIGAGMNMVTGLFSDALVKSTIQQGADALVDLSQGNLLSCSPGTVTCNEASAEKPDMPASFTFGQKFKNWKEKCQPIESEESIAAKCDAFGGVAGIDKSSWQVSGGLVNAGQFGLNFVGAGGAAKGAKALKTAAAANANASKFGKALSAVNKFVSKNQMLTSMAAGIGLSSVSKDNFSSSTEAPQTSMSAGMTEGTPVESQQWMEGAPIPAEDIGRDLSEQEYQQLIRQGDLDASAQTEQSQSASDQSQFSQEDTQGNQQWGQKEQSFLKSNPLISGPASPLLTEQSTETGLQQPSENQTESLFLPQIGTHVEDFWKQRAQDFMKKNLASPAPSSPVATKPAQQTASSQTDSAPLPEVDTQTFALWKQKADDFIKKGLFRKGS